MKWRLSFLVLAVLLLVGGVAIAGSGGPYELTWSTVDGGGLTYSAGGGYTLGGTAGQPDAGLLAGGDFILGGAFWGGGAVYGPENAVYLPLVLRGGP